MTAEGSITFVPSVHFSAVHRRRVRETIRETAPDLVAVELDDRRFDRLDQNQRMGPTALFQELPPLTAAMYGTLQVLQRTVVRFYGLDPTKTDMETAIETAAELDTDIALIDEPLGEMLSILSQQIGFDTLPKLAMRAQSLGPEYYTSQLEAMTVPFEEIDNGDDVEPMIDQMRQLLPEVTEVLIDRRDRAMAERLHTLRRDGYDVVAVIGAGHHNGIRRELEELEGSNEETAVSIRRSTRQITKIPIETT